MLFSVLWGFWKTMAVFDASHGALLLDCVSLSEKGRTGQGVGQRGQATTSLKEERKNCQSHDRLWRSEAN